MSTDDRNPGDVVRFDFNTVDTSFALATLSAGAVSVYKDSNLTESTAGVTLSTDFDGKTGLHQVVIDTSADGTFYAAGADFIAVLTAGTVAGIPVAGSQVGHFSLQNRTSLWNALTSALTASGSIGKLLVDLNTALTGAQAEPGQGALAANASVLSKIGYLYKFMRNKVTQDATTFKVFNDDAVTVDHKATVSDDGTTFTRGEIASGP